jgi:REP element-mobilizing transposase RayT
MELTHVGVIIEESWLSMVNLINNIELNEYVIMPNHFHGIITFLDTPTFKNSDKVADLSHIIAMFKSKTTNLIRRGIPLTSLCDISKGTLLISQNVKDNQSGQASLTTTQNNMPTFQWQKSFYDHVIRNEQDFARIREYIYNNPLKWQLDMLNSTNDDKYQKWVQRHKKPS